MQSNTDSALDLKNDILVSKKWKAERVQSFWASL